MIRSRLLIMAPLLLSAAGRAEPAAVSLRSGLAEPGWFKVSHGYIVQYNRVQKIAGREAVEVFDRTGRRVLALDVLGQLPGASDVTLDDVSVRSGRALVAGATVRNTAGSLQNMLLYFSWDGALEHSVPLPPAQEINNLDLDQDGSVWTLTDYFGRDDDTTGPLLFAYDPAGQLVKGLLRRTDYPAGIQENSRTGGVAGFGLTEEGAWFWQPRRHRITVVSREGRVVRQTSIALPKSRAGKARFHPPEISVVALLPSGRVAAGISSPWPDVPPGAYLSQGRRFVRTSAEPRRMIGVDGADLVFLSQPRSAAGEFEATWEPTPSAN